MNKVKYAIFSALVNFYRHRNFNLIVSVSFALGMLLPILCLGNINVFVQNVSTMQLKNDENSWIAYFDGGYSSIEETINSLQDNSLRTTDYAIAANRNGTIEINGVKTNGFMSYLTENWVEFENCKCIEGSLDMFAGNNICLIEQSLSDEYRVHLGDRLSVFGDIYTVSGVFSSFNYYGKILLPLYLDESDAESNVVFSKLYLRTVEKLPDGQYIAELLGRLGLPISNVVDGNKLYRDNLKKGFTQSAGIFGIGLIAFIFAAINICLVLIGKLNLDKRTYGISMAMGAAYRLVYLCAMIENMLCFSIAYLLDLVMIYILKPTYPEELTFILDVKVYVVAYIFGSLMTFVVTWAASRKLKKQRLVELLERVS